MDREAFVKTVPVTHPQSAGGRGGLPSANVWIRSPVLCMGLSVMLVACSTSLKVVPFKELRPETAVGIPFPLMFTRYDLEIKRQVIACTPQLTVKVTAELKGSKSAPDPNQMFTLQPNSLSAALKTSAVKTTYHATGSPATLNASAEDKTGVVVANAVGAAAKVVAIGVSSGPFLTDGGKKEEIVCSARVVAALSSGAALKPAVAAAGALVEKLTSDLADVMKRVAMTGNNPDQATKRELATTSKSLADATREAAAKTEELAKALKVLTFLKNETWPLDGDTGSGTLPMPPEVFNQWVMGKETDKKDSKILYLPAETVESVLNLPGIQLRNAETAQPVASVRFDELAKLSVALTLKTSGGAGRQSLAIPQKVEPELGVPYRAPAPGRLRVCAGVTCDDNDAALVQSDGQVQQLGYVYYLPCTSKPFSSITCTLEFAETGELKSAGTENKAAMAEGITAAAKDVLTQAAAAKEAKFAAGNKALEAKNAALKLQVDNAKLEASLSPNASQAEIDALKLETELANARKAVIDAREALEEAELKARS